MLASFEIIFLKKAKNELINSWEWYEDKQQGLGDKFLNEINNHISLIKKNPTSFPSYYKTFRQVPLKFFPFLVIYKIKKNKILIASIFHTSRNVSKKYK